MHLQSEGRFILLIVTFSEFRVYFCPYCNMTLRFHSLGLAGVLFSSQYLPLLLRKSSFTCLYMRLCSCCNKQHLAFDTQVGLFIIQILDCVIASMNTPSWWISLVASGMRPFSFVFVKPLVAQHCSHWHFFALMELLR